MDRQDWYNTEDEHLKRLRGLFGYEPYIDGEYPFYVDDKMLMEDNGTVVKKRYSDGKRYSTRLFPTSIHTPSGEHSLNAQTIRDEQGERKKTGDPFGQFVLSRHESLLTQKQLQFIADTQDGHETEHSPQLRYKYRQNMQVRLKRAYLGIGGDSVPLHLVSEYRIRAMLVSKLMEASTDNHRFQQLILRKLDSEWLNRVVYEYLSAESRLDIVRLYNHRTTALQMSTLSEVFDHVLTEYNRLADRGLV